MDHSSSISAVRLGIITLSCVGLCGCAAMGGYYAAPPSQQQPPPFKVLRPTELVYSSETLKNMDSGPPYVQSLDEGQPAAKAGIQKGDLIVRVAGEPTPSVQKAIDLMDGAGSKPVIFTVQRAGVEFEIPVTPGATKPRFGVQFMDRDRLYSVLGRDDVTTAIDQVVFGVLMREFQNGILYVDVMIANGSDRPIRTDPDEISVRAHGVPLRRLSPEETVNIVYGPAMAGDLD